MQLIFFISILRFSRTVLEIKDERSTFFRHKIREIIEKYYEELNNSGCINLIFHGIASRELIAQVSESTPVPVVNGHTDHFKCPHHLLLLDDESDILDLISLTQLTSQANILLVILDEQCPRGNNLSYDFHQDLEVVIICLNDNKKYALDRMGRLKQILDSCGLFPEKKSEFPDYMGTPLRVSTFNCPPFSYWDGITLNSSSNIGEINYSFSILCFFPPRRRT